MTGQRCFGSRVQKGIIVHVGAEAAESVLDRMKAFPTGDDEAAAPHIVRLTAVDLSSAEQVQKFIEDLKQIHHHTGEKIILVVFRHPRAIDRPRRRELCAGDDWHRECRRRHRPCSRGPCHAGPSYR